LALLLVGLAGCQLLGNFEDFSAQDDSGDAGPGPGKGGSGASAMTAEPGDGQPSGDGDGDGGRTGESSDPAGDVSGPDAGPERGSGGPDPDAGAVQDAADAGDGPELGPDAGPKDAADAAERLTWKDNTTGLEWQYEPFANFTQDQGRDNCAELSLAGPGTWRLPTIDELRTLVRGCPASEPGGACPVSGACTERATCLTSACEGCALPSCAYPTALGNTCDLHWSDTTVSDRAGERYGVDFATGEVFARARSTTLTVRCVR